jgi:hypothetical protein
MQRDGSEKHQMLEVGDLERPLGGDLTPLDAVIEVAKSDCPDEWSRYCDLAHQLVQRKQPTEISQEEAARQLLARNSKRLHRKDKSHLVRFGSMPLTEIEIMEAEAQTLEGHFRHRLHLSFEEGRYLLKAFDRLDPYTVPLRLIRPKHFRFESDEMELNEIKLLGVHFVRAQAASPSNRPGRKLGKKSAKDLACEIALSILNDEGQRPDKRHGRLIALARSIQVSLDKEGYTYVEDTIERFIRDTVKDWEQKNPGK